MSSPTVQNSDLCKECGGKCCRFIMLETKKDDEYKIEFWETQGNIKQSETENTVIYMQHCKCQHATDDGICDMYEDRPKLCRDFPRKDLPRLWRSVCPLFHEIHKDKKTILKVF